MRDIKRDLVLVAQKTEEALAVYTECSAADLALIYEAERYSLLGGGKRIRPYLVLAFCRLYGGEEAAAMPFACALEMIHTYSLIHDDLPCMDDDDLRRGRPTNHKKYGEAMAVLAGDALLTRAFGVAASNGAVSPEVALEAIRTLSASAGDGGMIGGQALDILGEERDVLTLAELERLQSLKTGALIRAAARLGCLAAGKMPSSPEAMAADTYAARIGLAFQIVDDVLDVVGDPALLGKKTGVDKDKHKITFMNYYGVDEALAYAARLTEEAVAAISQYEGSDDLCALAHYLSKRTY